MPRVRTLLPTVWAVFFVSGVAGLIYEVVWARYLDLVLGGTTYAHIMVLTAFMGGMAGGAWWFGQRADKFRRPLVTYAILELAVGAWGLLFPLLFVIASKFYLLLAGPLGTTGPGGIVNKLLFSVLLLVPSTFLMGGTLPILVRVVTSIPEKVGRRVAGLYFINSLGATGGALLAGFALIPGLGVQGALFFAATLNLLVGGILLLMWRMGIFEPRESGEEDETEEVSDAEAVRAESSEDAEESEREPFDTGQGDGIPEEEGPIPEFEGIGEERLSSWGRVAILGAGISGMIVMIYELAWVRLLSTILGSSTYSFTLMLSAFITGIAFGSLISRRLARLGRPFLLFGISQILVGGMLLLTLPLYAKLPYFFLDLQSSIPRTDSGYRLYEASKYLFCLLIMLPPTLASGAALPLAADVVARLRGNISQPVGRIWAVNTLGTIFGALGGGLLLLPLLGVELTLKIGIVINIAVGIWILSFNPLLGRERIRKLVVGTALLLIMFFGLSPAWDLRALALGAFHTRGDVAEARESFQTEYDLHNLIFYTEDINGTVATLQYEGIHSLRVNGKTDASTYIGDQVTQTLIAAIPALMVPDAKRTMVIGLGSGQTAGHLLSYPVSSVEIVEISRGVVEASRFFDNINGRPLDDPRTELIMQDAKTYLLTRPASRYDLILSEPSNPWIAGIGGLFSIEYFTTLREHLEIGGVVAQWIHSYQQTEETLTSVLMTFHEVFPYVSVWSLAPGDVLLVGSRAPLIWDLNTSQAMLERSAVSEDLKKIYISNLFTILNRQMLGPMRVDEIMSIEGPLNTDDLPYLEFHTPKATFMRSRATLLSLNDERAGTLQNSNLTLKSYLDGREPTASELSELATFFGYVGVTDYRLMTSVAAAWQKLDPFSAEAAESAGKWQINEILETIEEAAGKAHDFPLESQYVLEYADVLLIAYRQLRSCNYGAEDLALRLLEVLSWAADIVGVEEQGFYFFEHGKVAWDLGMYEEAMTSLRQTLDIIGLAADPDALAEMLGIEPEDIREQVTEQFNPGTVPAQVLELYGRVLLKLGRFSDAREAFWDSYRLQPDNPVAVYYFGELNRPDAASRFGRPPGSAP
ncbi:hypothetical protein ACFL3H_08310 [Gemmatimonadota bacterium]